MVPSGVQELCPFSGARLAFVWHQLGEACKSLWLEEACHKVDGSYNMVLFAPTSPLLLVYETHI